MPIQIFPAKVNARHTEPRRENIYIWYVSCPQRANYKYSGTRRRKHSLEYSGIRMSKVNTNTTTLVLCNARQSLTLHISTDWKYIFPAFFY